MGCCGKSTPLAAPILPSDWVLLEYIGTANDPITYTSPYTNERYRVALKHDKHLVYVSPQDTQWLLNTNHFKLAPVTEPDPEPTVESEPTPVKRGKK